MMINKTLQCLLLSVALLWSVNAFSSCYDTGNSVQQVASLSTNALFDTPPTAQFSSSVTCDSFVNIASYSRIDATLIGSQFLLNSASADAIPYTLYTDEALTTPFLLGDTAEFGSFNLIDLLGLFSNVDGTLPLYLRLSSANVPPGNYQDTITIQWDYDYCTSIGLLGVCLTRSTGTLIVNTTVQVEAIADCDIAAQDVDLGTQVTLSNVISSPLPIDVRCSKSMTYSVSIDRGLNAQGVQRHLSADQSLIAYNIIKPDNSNDNQTPDYAASGSGFNQALNYRVETVMSDTLPPSGSYTDTVIISVSY
jgi:spore coat protein U-like protein